MLGNGAPSMIASPGRGPNGPGPIDARKPIASVGIGTSSVPYGPTNGYAAFNSGVTGFIGPAAGSLQQPTAWYVRAAGSNTNGGTSASLTPERTGTDGAGTSTTTFTAASGNFTSSDVGKGININGSNIPYQIRSVTNSTTVILNRSTNTGSGWTWNLGGALASLNGLLAVGTTDAPRPGDVVYVGAGTYRETISLNSNLTQRFNGQANIVGDVTGEYTGDAGMVQLTAYTTNDKTAPSGNVLLTLNGKSNLAFSNIAFVSGSSTLLGSVATAQNITFRDCSFFLAVPGNRSFNITVGYGVNANLLFDRCVFHRGSGDAVFTLTTGGGPDYDANITFSNSLFVAWSGNSTSVTNSGVLAGKGGGVRKIGCAFIASARVMTTTASQISLVFPCSIRNCFISIEGTALSAGTLGQIVEDYNIISAGTPRTNVAVGSHSISDNSYAPLFHFSQERIWADPNGVPLFKPFGEPMQSSPLLGFGSLDPVASNPLDMLALPRPAGINSPLPAVGALERHNNWVADTAPIGDGSTPIKFTGPGDQAFIVPVPAGAITVTVLVAWDAAYQGTKPQLILQANKSIGVDGQTATAVGSGTVETLTVGPFTPTVGGKQVVIRLRSNDLTGTSVVQADQFTVTG